MQTLRRPKTASREYLAAIAMQGLLASGERGEKNVAERAVKMADALIEALDN